MRSTTCVDNRTCFRYVLMSDANELTDLQLAVMRVLWDRGEATVTDVQQALQPDRDLAQTTVATLLSRLEKKGTVTHRTEGRQYVYRALVSEGTVRRSMVAELNERLFGGDVAAMVSHLLGAAEIDPAELDRIKAFIEAKERELEDDHGR